MEICNKLLFYPQMIVLIDKWLSCHHQQLHLQGQSVHLQAGQSALGGGDGIGVGIETLYLLT